MALLERYPTLAIVYVTRRNVATQHCPRGLPGHRRGSSGGSFSRPSATATCFQGRRGLSSRPTVGYHRRLKHSETSARFERRKIIPLYFAAGLNVACCLAASQSEHRLDAPFAFAEILQFSSYAVLLGGALLDNVHLFESVRHLAVTDPLTGLANYRRLVDALDGEIQRSRRTGRRFSLLLFDLDGLKKVNDNYGHLVGSKALCRVANVLRVNSRSIDTAARYGGDEFALILPETGINAAQEVARRHLRLQAWRETWRAALGRAYFRKRGRRRLMPRTEKHCETLVGAAGPSPVRRRTAKRRTGRKLSVAV